MLARVDVLFYRNGVPIFHRNLQRKRQLVRKIGEFKKRVKLQRLTEERKTTFGSSYQEDRKYEGSRNRDSADISNKLILVFIDFLKIKLAKNFKPYMNPDPR